MGSGIGGGGCHILEFLGTWDFLFLVFGGQGFFSYCPLKLIALLSTNCMKYNMNTKMYWYINLVLINPFFHI